MIGRAMLLATVAAAAGLATSTAVRAADIPGDSSTKAVLPPSAKFTRSAFDFLNDSDWFRVQVVRGEHYAVSATAAPPSGVKFSYARVSLRDAAGRLVRSTEVEGGGGVAYSGGFEFTATRTGTLFVTVDNFGFADAVYPYDVRFAKDVSNDYATDATLKVGQPKQGVFFFIGDDGADDDWYKVVLTAGQTYTFLAAERRSKFCDVVNGVSDCIALKLRDKNSVIVAASGANGPTQGGLIRPFKVLRTGIYYLSVTAPLAIRFTVSANLAK